MVASEKQGVVRQDGPLMSELELWAGKLRMAFKQMVYRNSWEF